MRKPLIELSDCITCGVCAEVSPEIFRLSDAGYLEIAELATYPEDEVNEAMPFQEKECMDGSTINHLDMGCILRWYLHIDTV